MWKTDTLEKLCNIEYGTRVTRKKEQGTIYPVYGGGGETFRIDKKNRNNSVVISRFGMSERCTRFVHGDFFLNDSGLTLSPKNNDLSQNFLNKIIFSLNNKIFSIGRGTAQKNLDMEAFKKLTISYPPLVEQQRIVAKLDATFAEIETAKYSTELSYKYIQSLYEAISRDVFFKGDSIVSLGDIADVTMGQSPKGDTYNYDGIGIPLINGPVEFEDDSFGLSKSIKFTTEPKKFCEAGDALLCVRGSTTGRMNIARVDASIGRGVAAIRAHENQLWINYFLQSSRKYIYSLGTGATFPNITMKQIQNIQIRNPIESEKKQLVERLSKAYKNVLLTRTIYKSKLTDLNKLKSSILSQELQSSNAA